MVFVASRFLVDGRGWTIRSLIMYRHRAPNITMVQNAKCKELLCSICNQANGSSATLKGAARFAFCRYD